MKIIDLIEKKIEHIQGVDICVLKGFLPSQIKYLQDKGFKFIDDFVLKDGYVDIDQEIFIKLITSLSQKQEGLVYMAYESLLTLCSNLTEISSLNLNFCILSNNILSRYINPTTTSIPDFESDSFENSERNGSYSNLYSNCIHENGFEYIEYIKLVTSEDCIQTVNLITPSNGDVNLETANATDYPVLSLEGNGIDMLLEQLYYNGKLACDNYLIEQNAFGNDRLQILFQLCNELQLSIHFYGKKINIRSDIRPELFETLKKIWGYDSFRKLKIYNDLIVDRSVSDISQGEIIENVVRQAEIGLKGDKDLSNILLTAPTGAGKSLLFQLSAIYLAEKYDALTIVVSPLVALMEDQVSHLQVRYSGVATLNSNKTPQQKEKILEGVKNGDINILYVSPELLLSYTINTFIGNRHLGLLVIDEAHTVTTWGRDFRVDYWFLGSYLRSSMKILKYKFPIFALTATAVWDPSRKNDMVFETIDSLFMAPCIKYIGVVRRDDIKFEIGKPKSETAYTSQRIQLTADFIRSAIANSQKAIVYFPFKKDIDNFIYNAKLENVQDKIARYHGGMNSTERNVNASAFKRGDKIIMLATKAFGMGIDVSDIKIVYHHAPSGSLSDYVQEIGRAARKEGLQGIAKIDFMEKDLKYAKQLFGLSAIKPYQVKGVLKKLMSLYDLNGNKRNMIISPEDFSYLYPGDDVDYDQKVKSTLLLISNDLQRKLNYNILIVRPKNLFSKSYISVPSNLIENFRHQLDGYYTPIDVVNNIFILDCEKLWNDHFSGLTFSQFKYQLGTGGLNYPSMQVLDTISVINKLVLSLDQNYNNVVKQLEEFFNISENILNELVRESKRLPIDGFRNKHFGGCSPEKIEQFFESFKLVYCNNDNPYCKFYHKSSDDEASHLQMTSSGYAAVRAKFMRLFYATVNREGSETVTYSRPDDDVFALSQLLNSLGLATYERIGGEKPSIFVRINNPFYLNQLVRKGDYTNNMLEDIYNKFEYSKHLFIHFFTHDMDNSSRWDFIEDYFLGTSMEDLLRYGIERNA
jgi:RecQ family ATP-dependent DNA helicase